MNEIDQNAEYVTAYEHRVPQTGGLARCIDDSLFSGTGDKHGNLTAGRVYAVVQGGTGRWIRIHSDRSGPHPEFCLSRRFEPVKLAPAKPEYRRVVPARRPEVGDTVRVIDAFCSGFPAGLDKGDVYEVATCRRRKNLVTLVGDDKMNHWFGERFEVVEPAHATINTAGLTAKTIVSNQQLITGTAITKGGLGGSIAIVAPLHVQPTFTGPVGLALDTDGFRPILNRQAPAYLFDRGDRRTHNASDAFAWAADRIIDRGAQEVWQVSPATLGGEPLWLVRDSD